MQEGETTGEGEKEKQSNHVARKIAERVKDRKLDPHLEDQFASGRLLASISSRPGQCGRADGYAPVCDHHVSLHYLLFCIISLVCDDCYMCLYAISFFSPCIISIIFDCILTCHLSLYYCLCLPLLFFSYILEGKELEFYQKKIQRKKGKSTGAAA